MSTRVRWTAATVLAAVSLLLVSPMLRAPISSVPPALREIAQDLSLGAVAAGMVTTLPLLCFGIFAFITPALARRFGGHATLLVAIALCVVGILLRSVPSALPFFAGVTVIGLGIAIGNVIIPALIRAEFAGRLALLMGWYSLGLQIGGAVGPIGTAPLLAAGLGWQGALGVWVLPGVLVLVLWLIVTLRARGSRALGGAAAPTTSMGTVVRRPLTIAICLFMGLQSMGFYTLLTWIPTQLADHGFGQTQAGLLLGLFGILGLPGSFLGPALAQSRFGSVGILIIFVLDIVGVLLLLGPGVMAVVGTVLAGLCQGALLSTALTFIAHQADPADVPAVSALAQGIGYSLAALGPVVMGALYDGTGGWVSANILLGVALAVAGSLGFWIARTEYRHRAYRLLHKLDPGPGQT